MDHPYRAAGITGAARGVQSSAQPEESPAVEAVLARTELTDITVGRLYRWIKQQLVEEAPALLKLVVEKPELQVMVKRHVIEADGDTMRGQIAQLIADGFFAQPTAGGKALQELARRGQAWNFGRFAQELSGVAKLGFLYVTEGKDDRNRTVSLYQAVPGMKVNIREVELA